MSSTLGHRLQQAREMRGLSLQDAAHQTRIPLRRLMDLEQDTYTHFGGLAYARSFLRVYARFLEVDATEVLEQIQVPPLGGVRDYRYLTTSYGSWVPARHHRPVSTTMNAIPAGRSLLIVGMLCSTVLILGVTVLLGNVWFNQKQEPETTVAKALPAVEERREGQESWTAPAEPPRAIPVEESEIILPAADVVEPVKAVAVEDPPVPKARKALPVR